MRRILVEQARRKASLKHGGGWQRVEMGDVAGEANAQSLDLLALDDALKQLAAKDPRKAELVKLRFFAGLTIPQAAEAIGISSTTADNDWAYAKSWLRVQMADAEPAAVQL
jgi:RNA polymerase sigma factor (TIGR02999 family)